MAMPSRYPASTSEPMTVLQREDVHIEHRVARVPLATSERDVPSCLLDQLQEGNDRIAHLHCVKSNRVLLDVALDEIEEVCVCETRGVPNMSVTADRHQSYLCLG